MRQAIYLPPFGELAEPAAIADVAAAAESSGWEGLFLWDHMWRPNGPVVEVADVWIALAAAAARTSVLRLGPMVVPLSRRRPQKVARESVSLDRLSSGRLTLGVGLGVDTGGELGRFGEETDEVLRAEVLDEAIEVLLALWTGEEVHHEGRHFTVDGARFLPTSVQPRIPIWGAARGGGSLRPVRRAARLDGIFPVGTSPDQLAVMLEVVRAVRGGLDGYDVAYGGESDDEAQLARLGVTWRLRSVREGTTLDEVLALATAGPPGR
jgi:alkanesulfonate monooxygenase SsuD/methylene tetrahydromethanopterin reductase-like flavin-dependent oxidoreductase (luciferase family)